MKIIRAVLATLLAVICLSCQEHQQPDEASPLDWHINLDQPIGQLEEVLAATHQQQPMNYTSSNIAFVYDAKLYIVYEQHRASLPSKDRGAAAENQRKWLEERNRVTHESYMEYEGGTFASFAGNKAFIGITKRRIAELELEISAIEGKGSVSSSMP